MIVETDSGKGASSTISWRQVFLFQENTSFWKTKELEAGAHLLTECAMGLTWNFLWETNPPLSVSLSAVPLMLFKNNLVERKQAWGKSPPFVTSGLCLLSAQAIWTLWPFYICHPFQPCWTSSQITGEKQGVRAEPASVKLTGLDVERGTLKGDREEAIVPV